MPVTNSANFKQIRASERFTVHPSTGNVFFVDSVTGSATGGYHPDGPAATLTQALALCTANNNDTIFVFPTHAEAVVGAAGIAFNKAGVTVVGMGSGRGRPTITLSTSTAAQITITAANTTIQNCVFDLTGIDAIVAGIAITAADVAIRGCEFIMQAAAASPALGILTAATAARLVIDSNRFLGLATTTGGTLAACVQHEVGVDFQITNNYFRGKMTQAVLNATTILGGLIANNKFHIYTGTKGISLAAGTTGSGFDNRLSVPSGTTPVVGAGFTWASNNYSTEALAVGTPTAAAF
jgi:hypothetical protein